MVEQSQSRNQSGDEQLEAEIQSNQLVMEQTQEQNRLAESGQVQVVPPMTTVQVLKKPQLPPVDWQQPTDEKIPDECLKWFTEYIQGAAHDKMSNDDFDENLQHYLSLSFIEHCDESFSKLAAMHKYPEKIVNKEDCDFLKESAFFVKHIIKPTEQRGAVLGKLAHKSALGFSRDHPDLKKMTERYAALCIHVHGRAKIKDHAQKFVSKLVGFCEEFTARTASMPSKWNTPAFRDVNSLLRLACGSGDYCPRGCGKIHADLFTNDDCKFDQNKLSTTEKEVVTKYKSECEQAKKDSKDPPAAKKWEMTEAYYAEIMEQAQKFIVYRGEGDVRCLLCIDV